MDAASAGPRLRILCVPATPGTRAAMPATTAGSNTAASDRTCDVLRAISIPVRAMTPAMASDSSGSTMG